MTKQTTIVVIGALRVKPKRKKTHRISWANNADGCFAVCPYRPVKVVNVYALDSATFTYSITVGALMVKSKLCEIVSLLRILMCLISFDLSSVIITLTRNLQRLR